MVSYVSYLGHQIHEDGLHPLPDKVQAGVEAPSPEISTRTEGLPGATDL